MSTMNRQKFMTIFNDILSDRAGNNAMAQNLKELGKGGDEIDVLNSQRDQSINMRLDQRNILFLKKVEEAKQKILDGTYGDCEDCGEEISQKRLLARPTASLCINCQEEKEKTEFNNFNKRRDLKEVQMSEDQVGEHIKTREAFTSVKDIAFESVVDL